MGLSVQDEGPLSSGDFTRGLATVVRFLRRLGFEVEDHTGPTQPGPELAQGETYSWADLGKAFEFSPAYLSIAGGMFARPEQNAVLLITHPEGAKAFDYGDYWDGNELVYTGRGPRRSPLESRRG